jgi:hypothetical protein
MAPKKSSRKGTGKSGDKKEGGDGDCARPIYKEEGGDGDCAVPKEPVYKQN